VTDARFVDNVSLFRRVLYNMGTVDITGSTFDHNGGTIENRAS
jgi:hypothetical protein